MHACLRLLVVVDRHALLDPTLLMGQAQHPAIVPTTGDASRCCISVLLYFFFCKKRSATQIKVICDPVQQFSDINVCNMDHMDNSGKVLTAGTIFLSALCCSLGTVIRIMCINVVF